ncbi:hypothetical protein ALC57_05380 [Trachymyrmex cornetzi]|uniref:Uncharacterized protein n=1 Tax=Trachymyrmex cornetzi TaxID=471704 RepID=A0A151JB96_9HYME|nr:hypothetical protein ALC57_05380 [Trachymyrmex cornetzi]
MEVDFEEILNEDSSDEESVLSDDTSFISDASEYETDLEEKFIPAAEIRALNDRTKYYAHRAQIKNYFKQYCERDMENRDVVNDVLYVLGNQRKKDINDVRIPPVQFLRDRELGIRGEKHGKVITSSVSAWSLLARQRVYTRLREECKNDDNKNINVNVIKDDYYWAKKIADKIRRWCTCIKIPAGSDKCVELLIIDNMWHGLRGYIPNLFFDLCNDRCFECEQCIFAHKHNRTVIEQIVLGQVRDTVERHRSAKVNTAFNGEFATNGKRAIKSINTKNIEIYRCTDIREWYERHVIEPTSSSLR